MSTSFNRRQFLCALGAGSLALSVGTQGYSEHGTKPSFGVSLFLFIESLEQDFIGTLKLINKVGFSTVESIGAMGRDPSEVKDYLDASGLISPSQHLAPGDLYQTFLGLHAKKISAQYLIERYVRELSAENVEAVISEGIERALAMGQSQLVWPIVFPGHIHDRKAVEALCHAFNKAGAMCQQAGITFLFHNHAREFAVVDGVVPYEQFLLQTDPELVKFQMDAYWITKAGANPGDYFRRFPSRFKSMHLKDMDSNGRMTEIGSGQIDFARLIGYAKQAGVDYFFLEYDESPNALVSSKIALNELEFYFKRGV